MTTPAVSQSLTSRGFGADVVPRQNGPTLDAVTLIRGAVVKHIATEQKKFVAQGENRAAKLHTFQLPVAHGGGVFSVWGSQQLDTKLRELRPGAVLLLQYGGREAPKTEGEKVPHVWTVRPWTGSQADLRNAVAQEWAEKHYDVAAAIERANNERAAEARKAPEGGRAPDAAPPDDSDVSVF